MNLKIVILAAGQGTRMKSKIPKVLHKVLDKPMLDHVMEAAQVVTNNKPIVVIGHMSDMVREHLGDKAEIALQEEQLGTGHAVMMAEHYIDDETRPDLVMYAKELEEESAVYSELSPDYLAETSKLITIFANGLELSGEFRDIAYALRGLCKPLNELEQTHHLFGTSSRIIKRIIDSIIDDLVNWTSEVLIDLTAVDVHYVDASLLANIAQLSLTVKNMLKSEEETSLEDELELF